MAYNHAKEELVFANHWAKLRDEYVQAGMSEDAIQAMYEFDRSVFNSNRTYKEHTVRLVTEDDAEDEDELAYAQELLKNNFLAFAVFDSYMGTGKYDWIETIENKSLVCALRALSAEDLELLTLYVFADLTQCEIARNLGVSQPCIVKKIKKIKKILEKWL